MPPRIIANKYVLEREIGRGGMGLVWEATDQHLRRRVALKLMTPEHTTQALLRSRFEREAMAIARLRNHHVIQIYDYGLDGDCPYIVMELLEGEDLATRLTRQRRLPLATAREVVGQVAKGLSAAHASGIVHRDLKPANIFLARASGEEVVKLVDFGIVSVQADADGGPEPPSARAILGTPAYMSPEQMRASALDHRTDLWSLAVVAYEALTGELPFDGATFSDLFVSVFAGRFEPPTSLVPELPPETDAFFERALAKDPARRFQSARELAEALGALCKADPRGPAKVLVVDDERDTALLIKQCFQRQIRDSVYEFFFAADGEEALEALRRHPDVDVILTDINMPRMDGLTLLGRASELTPMARTIVVSAYDDMGNIRGAMNRGASDFLVKPIDFDDLTVTLEKAIKHVAEARRSARSHEENSVLRMFVNPSLVQRLTALGPFRAIAGEALNATVAFVDVCGFAAVAREAPPEDAAQILNAIFEVIVPELAARGGIVDKFLGDAVMVVFQGQDHVVRALDACVAARACLETIAARAGEGSPYARGIAAGVATGELLAAGVGSKAAGRLDYTVLGDVVDAAEHLTRSAASGQILVDAAVAAAAGDLFALEEVGVRELPGRGVPAAVYSVAGRARPEGAYGGGPTGIRSSDDAPLTSTLDAEPAHARRKQTAPS